MTERELEYIKWQNRSCRFYLAARTLHWQELHAAAAFCAHQAAELMMKATLHYWDRSFKPRDPGHNLMKMKRMIGNKVRNRPSICIPEYFVSEQRFLNVTRYPTGGKGVVVPSTLIPDLDRLIVDLVVLVPFQFNSELLNAATGRNRRALLLLRRHNAELRRLRRFLACH